MKELLESVIKALVEKTEAVEITETGNDSAVIYEIKVDRSDIGKIIGKDGKIANAIRVIFNAMAKKNKKQMLMRIEE